ncbi:unnamed protein product, partial [Durusdinium trenchii]
TAPLLLAVIVSDLDPISGKDLALPLLPAIKDLFNIPRSIGGKSDAETVSFEAIQLSTQGAERQKKDVMKVAARFEKLIEERRHSEDCKDLKDDEILTSIIQRYNQYKANSALKRWQVSPDQHSAIAGVIWGMCPDAKALVRQHL